MAGSAAGGPGRVKKGTMITKHDPSPYGAITPDDRVEVHYSDELAQEICQRISEGQGVALIGRSEGMPTPSTIHKWLLDGKHPEFQKKYEQAVNIRAEHLFEEILEIADESKNDWIVRRGEDGSVVTVVNKEVVNRSRLRIDTRKWYLAKVMPKKFGDKLDLTSDGRPLPTPLLGGATKDD